MRYRLFVIGLVFSVLLPHISAWGGQADDARQKNEKDAGSAGQHWLRQDLRMTTGELLSQDLGSGQHLIICRNDFSMSLAGQQYFGQGAVVWIEIQCPESEQTSTERRYRVGVYLSSPLVPEAMQASSESVVKITQIEPDQALVLEMEVEGEVYMTADKKETASPHGLLLYRRAMAAFESTGVIQSSEPNAPPRQIQVMPIESPALVPEAGYNVGVAPLTDAGVQTESKVVDGIEVTTVMGRFQAWWQMLDPETEATELVELQADNLVLWYMIEDPNQAASEASSAQYKGVVAVYVAGDVQLTQGARTIRAEELYYDLRQSRGIATNAVMKMFDASRNIPLYVRAAELKQTAINKFDANDVTVTTSEFWTPQMSVTAGSIHIVDLSQETPVEEGGSTDNSFDAEMRNIRLKYYDATIFAWPSLRPNFESPDMPIRSVRVGRDRTYGSSVESRWFLSRLLGLREPEGTDGTLEVDYYGKRGLGVGVDIEYEREDYFGHLLGYYIQDHGEDRLSRTEKNVEVPDENRGRFQLQHRHFLPYSWQLTAEIDYLSDENFLKQFYRGEFNVGKERETLLHLKRIEDNWGLAFLGKTRINDFYDKVEELPSGEFHWTGQSLFNDIFTFYSDSQASHYRYLYSTDTIDPGSEEFFEFVTTRNELDMPLSLGKSKIVPFVAGTFTYEDGGGFQTSIDEDPKGAEDEIWIGEGGVRMSTNPFWRVYPGVHSRLWDLNQIRHVIRPRAMAVAYAESNWVAEQRDTMSLGVSQRWQTKRGPLERQRTVDWLRWDVDMVWVANSGDATAGPDQLLWNKPFIPIVSRAGDVLFPLDRRTTGLYGPRRNHVQTEMALRLTDTTSILGDMNFDMQSGVVQQLNVGFARLCWPNLSYYLGSRYLRRIVAGDERGSNAVTFAATYVIDPRYTLVFSEQYDFDYGAGIRSDITLIRKYHRTNFALTVSSDDSLDEHSITVGFWPEGVPELSLGLRKYADLGTSEVY